MRAPDAVQEHIWQKVHLRPEASVPRQPFHPVSPTSLPDEAVHEPPSFGGRFGNSLVWACFITVVLGYCRGFDTCPESMRSWCAKPLFQLES